MPTKSRIQEFFTRISHKLNEAWQAIYFSLYRGRIALRNRLRKLRRYQVDYVVIPISGSLPERANPPRNFIQRQLPLPADPLSLETLELRLNRIVDAPNIKGALFILTELSAGIATLQSLRMKLLNLRSSGKECIVFTPYLDMAHYFVASAADRIIVPPGATFEVLGLHSEAIFLKDGLTKLGIQTDVIQISPYKGAFDALDKSNITPEQQEQLNWLLDESYDVLTSAIAKGRRMNSEDVKALIDQSPMPAEKAKSFGLIDEIAYEDQLAFLLADSLPHNNQPVVKTEKSHSDEQKDENETKSKAELLTWSQAHKRLIEKTRRPSKKYIGVISLEGAIVMGPSRRFPIKIPVPLPILGGNIAGHETIIGMLRRVERSHQMGALIFHVDSGGGSALASDLIWREICRIAQYKPVVAYLGNVAASGGYYVVAGAHKIVSQKLTITGSIGVISLHVSTAEMYQKLGVNRVTFKRGKRANLHSDTSPLDDEERQVLWDNIKMTYSQFKRVVADGRKLVVEDLDPICEGRIWTGRQALERKLVDSLGDFNDAIKVAAELAEMPIDDDHEIPVYNFYPRGQRYILPKPYEAADEISRFISWEGIREIIGRPLFIMPFEIKLW